MDFHQLGKEAAVHSHRIPLAASNGRETAHKHLAAKPGNGQTPYRYGRKLSLVGERKRVSVVDQVDAFTNGRQLSGSPDVSTNQG